MTEQSFRTARLFKILGNPLRYKILLLLRRGPFTTGELADAVNRPIPAVSRALGLLHWAGLVHYRTFGRSVAYELKHGEVSMVLVAGESFTRQFELPGPAPAPTEVPA